MATLRQRISRRLPVKAAEGMSTMESLPQLALLGLLSGVVTGIVILGFRLAIEWPLARFLPGHDPEAFEQLSLLTRGLLPLLGACALGLFLHYLADRDRRVGVACVMQRLNYHQGHISLRSALIQFVVGVGTIVSGQSAGREGPAIHLGAACSSLIGQWLRLPNSSIRTLVACGCAAAISASFNTPIAGVIFAMEVVMMEYTIAGFTPIILASVSAAVVSQAVYSAAPAFAVPALNMNSLLEIPWILAIAVCIGLAAAAFIFLVERISQYDRRPILLRVSLAGLVMLPFALLLPQVMGIGYDTVDQALHGELSLRLLLAVGAAKLLVTAITVGMGMPSSVIGPTLFTGATLGAAMGLIGAQVAPDTASSVGFYAMLGMGAMMGAVLQAPLAALMALLELTHNPNIILPGMLVITTASLVTSEFFGRKSIFQAMLKSQGLSYQSSPVVQALRRVSVGRVMDRSVLAVERRLSPAAAVAVLESGPRWLLLENGDGPRPLLLSADLARYLEEEPPVANTEDLAASGPIDLLAIPAHRREAGPLPYQATLEQALQEFDESQAEALYVYQPQAAGHARVLGVVTREDIEGYYQYRDSSQAARPRI